MTIQKGMKAAVGLITGVVLALCLNLFWSARSEAQVAGATLSGEITDPSGAAIANATVSIKNVGTGEAREVQSNGDGFYSAPNLLPGSYEVSASAEGFSKVVQKGITLTVGAQQSLSLSLKPGKVTEVINVTDTPPDVQTTTTAVSSTDPPTRSASPGPATSARAKQNPTNGAMHSICRSTGLSQHSMPCFGMRLERQLVVGH